jgi:hypothetical protein
MKTQKPDWSVERREQRWAGNLLKTWLSSIDPQINTKAGKAVRCTFNETCAFNGNERVPALEISTNIDFAGAQFVGEAFTWEARSLHRFVEFLNGCSELDCRHEVLIQRNINTGNLELKVKVTADLD